MRIGIDISQVVFEGTGVARYVDNLVRQLLTIDTVNEYVLFGASLRQQKKLREFFTSLHSDKNRICLKIIPIPPTVLSMLWNWLHIISIEKFIGSVDIFWSSDWTQPPLGNVQGITTIHDVIALKFPIETDTAIVKTHARRLHWVAKECDMILCDSESTKQDVQTLLHIEPKRLSVIYPGI